MQAKTKNVILEVIRFVLKFILPVVCGYVEGDSHVVTDFVSTIASSL